MAKAEPELLRLTPPKGEPPTQISTSDFSGGTRIFDLESDGAFITSDQEAVRILTTRHGYTAQKADARAKATELKKKEA